MFSTVESFIAWGLTTLVAAFVGSYLGGYLRKKGENHATHEDIDKLIAQVAAVTTTTKEIEAKISNDVWERQRKWEVKREALFEAMKELASVQNALTRLDSAYRAASSSDDPNAAYWLKAKSESLDVWSKTRVNFDIAKTLALLVCSEEVKMPFLAVDLSIGNIANTAIFSNQQTLHQALPTLVKQLNALTNSVRKELHVD
jgi:uncharacterized Tic20 family protein